MVKTDTILVIGALALGGYLVYRLAKPLEETVSGVGGGVSTAVQGAGRGISEITTGVSSPFRAVGTSIDRSIRQAEAYTQGEITGVKAAQPQITERIVSQEKQKSLRQQEKTSITAFNTSTTQKALNNLTSEQVTRKTEYGVNVGQFFQKTFMPTREQAQVRRETAISNAKSNISAIGRFLNKGIKGISGIVKPKALRR